MTRSKSEYVNRRYWKLERRKRLFVLLMILLSCVIVWGSIWVLNQRGPQKVHSRNLSLKDEVTTENQASFENSRQKLSVEKLKALSLELEMEAEALAGANKFEEASEKYKEAFKLQEIINNKYPLDPGYDAGRAIQMQLQVQNLAAEPLLRLSLELEERASSHKSNGNTAIAIETLNRAITLQKLINREYRESSQASTLRLEQLKEKMTQIEMNEAHTEIESVLEQAKALQATGKKEEASNLYQQAAYLQEQLNKAFPRSPHASSVRVELLQEKSQNIQSTAQARMIKKRCIQLKNLLAGHRIEEAIQLIESLHQEIQQFEATFSLSQALDDSLKKKIDYLNKKKDVLKPIQNRVYASLLPLPDAEGILMLRTEVSQNLYTALSDVNPSRNKAESNPVDSVSSLEAQVFCTRLSWVLGKKVRLPTEEEFRKALGNLNAFDEVDSIWNVANAKGLSQPVGQKTPFQYGHFDLLGNVSEWLYVPEPNESPTVQHIGGHAQDSLEVILSVPVRDLSDSERNRLIGFRVVLVDGS